MEKKKKRRNEFFVRRKKIKKKRNVRIRNSIVDRGDKYKKNVCSCQRAFCCGLFFFCWRTDTYYAALLFVHVPSRPAPRKTRFSLWKISVFVLFVFPEINVERVFGCVVIARDKSEVRNGSHGSPPPRYGRKTWLSRLTTGTFRFCSAFVRESENYSRRTICSFFEDVYARVYQTHSHGINY